MMPGTYTGPPTLTPSGSGGPATSTSPAAAPAAATGAGRDADNASYSPDSVTTSC